MVILFLVSASQERGRGNDRIPALYEAAARRRRETFYRIGCNGWNVVSLAPPFRRTSKMIYIKVYISIWSASMGATAKLFKNGRSQAVRLPAEFRFEGTEVDIRRDPETGDVILSQKPQRTGSFDAFFKSRAEIPAWELEGFMEDREQGEHERDDPLA